VHRRGFPSIARLNEEWRKEREGGEDSGKRGLFRNLNTMNGDTSTGGRDEEKSVPCLPVSLEPELYFVIASALSR